MGAKKESTIQRNKSLVSEARSLKKVSQTPGFIVDALMEKYKISFRTLTNILRTCKTNL
jgi:Mor family transcriptional regulator